MLPLHPLSTHDQAVGRLLRSFHIGISWSTGGAGGSGRVFADLSRYLPENGCTFTGAVTAPADVAEQTNGAVTNLFSPGSGPLKRFLSSRASLMSRLEQEQPDVVATHFALYGLPILDQMRKYPEVTHFHGPWSAESKAEGAGALSCFLKQKIERSVYKRAQRTIVLSEAFAKIAVEQYGVGAESVRIVPGAVDLHRFKPVITQAEARERLGWSADRRILFSVRRLVNRMGLHHLIDAMAEITKTQADAVLYIAGKGRLKAQLEEQIRQRGVEKTVCLLGFVADDDLPLMFQAADLSVVPTTALEGFGLVAAESLAAGTPTMVTPVGGLPEVVRGLQPGLIFESATTKHITEGISAALTGKLQLPTRAECLAYARDNFDPNVMAARTVAVYREVL